MPRARYALSLTLSLLVAPVATASPAKGTRVLRQIEWSTAKSRGMVTAGQVLAPDSGTPFARLRVIHTGQARKAFALLTIERPGIRAARYALRGRIRHTDVHGTGYLEMWSVFPGGRRYFSRSLAPAGPMGRITGTSGWRPFALPFSSGDRPARPVRLELNLVLAGPGTVELGPVQLVSHSAEGGPAPRPPEAHPPDAAAWWSGPMAGILGGTLGALIGLLGFLIGLLGSRGRARRLVLGSLAGFLVAGLGLVASGVVALILGQPARVHAPLVGLGVLTLALGLLLLPRMRRIYQEHELRRIDAMDLRAG